MSEPTRIRLYGKTSRPWVALVPLVLVAGCATLGEHGEARALVPTRYQIRTGPFLVYSSTPLPADSPSIRCLHALETDLSSRLDYRSGTDDEPVEIYVLDSRNAYAHFLKFYFPELPTRRAFFLAQGPRRVVYTYLSDRLEEDLRHEATHALVRGCYGDLPLWLDEGLAEYFETRTDTIDAQDEHLSRIPDDLKKGWAPDLARLESLTDIHDMTPRDYRESWAWVHMMLADPQRGKPLLLEYLAQGRGGARPRPLSQLLAARGTTARTLLAHLEALQSQSLARKTEPPSHQDGLIRFQESAPGPWTHPAEVMADRTAQPQKQGFLRRIGAWLGF